MDILDEGKIPNHSYFKRLLCYDSKSVQENCKNLRTDNGVEFLSNDCERLLSNFGIFHQTTCAYSPQQNGNIGLLCKLLELYCLNLICLLSIGGRLSCMLLTY